jgi:hypothetical protein
VKAGDLVYDSSINKYGMIIEAGIDWTDSNGVTYAWDYEVLYSDGRRAYADVIEISPAEEACK